MTTENPAEKTWDVGPDAQIDPDVILGYRYPGWSKKLRTGQYFIQYERQCSTEPG